MEEILLTHLITLKGKKRPHNEVFGIGIEMDKFELCHAQF